MPLKFKSEAEFQKWKKDRAQGIGPECPECSTRMRVKDKAFRNGDSLYTCQKCCDSNNQYSEAVIRQEYPELYQEYIDRKKKEENPRAPSRHLEDDLQMQCCQYVKFKYPGVILNVDASGLKLSRTQAGRLKAMKSDDHFCDIQIMRARGGYHGLFLELKIEGTKLQQVKTPGKAATKHIYDQGKTIVRLRKEGYYAAFCRGYVEFIAAVDWYMELKAIT